MTTPRKKESSPKDKKRQPGTMVSQTGQVMPILTVERIGFYGCQYLDRPIRVGVTGTHYPRAGTIECPCGRTHKTKFLWRELNDGEELRAETWIESKEDTND